MKYVKDILFILAETIAFFVLAYLLYPYMKGYLNGDLVFCLVYFPTIFVILFNVFIFIFAEVKFKLGSNFIKFIELFFGGFYPTLLIIGQIAIFGYFIDIIELVYVVPLLFGFKLLYHFFDEFFGEKSDTEIQT